MQSKLIEFTDKANETAHTIATHVKDSLEKRILLKKCVAFTGDRVGLSGKRLTNRFFAIRYLDVILSVNRKKEYC